MARAVKAAVATTGPVQVDKTPAAVPATLPALETAEPAAGQPTGERWVAVYGTAPDYQVATVLGGAWVAADTDPAAVTMTGATAGLPGTSGVVPQPAAGTQDSVLHADGLWRQVLPNWTANTDYSQGAYVRQNQGIWRRNTAGLSGLVFDATEEAEWLLVADATDGVGVQTWATATTYTAGDLVIESDRLYRATTGHTSSATFAADAANWVEVSAGSAANITEGTLNAAAANRTVDMGDNTLTVTNASQATLRSQGPIGATEARLFLDGNNSQQAYLESIDGAGFRQSAAEVTGSNVNLYSRQTTLREAGGGGAPELRLVDDADTNYVGFKAAPAVGASVVWTLPTADGAAGSALTTDGAAGLSWTPTTVERFVRTTAGQTLTIGEQYQHQVGHIVNLPALSAANDEQVIRLVGAEPWGTAMGAADWVPNGADTLNYPAGGLPAGSVDVVTLVADFANTQWLVRTGGSPAPDVVDAVDSVATLPDPTTVSAGDRVSVTNDPTPALIGVYVATGPVGAAGTGWQKS